MTNAGIFCNIYREHQKRRVRGAFVILTGGKGALERYRYCGGKKLRCGVTTGTCAAAAAKAAALRLLGRAYGEVRVTTPAGIAVTLKARAVGADACGVVKDAGDDPDVTDGLLICAQVERAPGGIRVEGGAGIGRVTRPGLEQPVGAAAINRVPRQMIAGAVADVLDGGAKITIFVPEGERIAQKTCNPRLGITGGISILGTTGIVEPMSEAALTESIRLELSACRAEGAKEILVTPGNYGETFAREAYGLHGGVLCSNFIGDAVDYAAALRFRGFLLVGHAGKLVKLAGGIFSTHSRTADARMEILAAHGALAGAGRETVREILECVTTDGAFDLLEREGLLRAVLETLAEKLAEHLSRRGGRMETGAVMFTNPRGELLRTPNAAALMERLKRRARETI